MHGLDLITLVKMNCIQGSGSGIHASDSIPASSDVSSIGGAPAAQQMPISGEWRASSY